MTRSAKDEGRLEASAKETEAHPLSRRNPPSQRPSSFGIDQIVEKMQRSLEATAQ